MSGKPFDVAIPDKETVRLIYTRKKEYKEGTVSIHLTREDLEDIIAQIDRMEEPDKAGRGVRLYIARYPDHYPPVEEKGTRKKVDYSNCLTVVAVPTYKGLGNVHFDFMEPQKVKKYKQEIQNDPVPPPAVSGEDHYHLCPPNTDCNTGATIWNNL
ncbi:MAG TPA: hypothetical protein VFF57_06460, partial [Hanamia sp.]|nr:hypothetical protein [Hanamia sp.]